MAKKAKKYFLIVDGHALLHRAWHALPPLTTKDGTLVHGAYGFTTILLSAVREFEPDCVAVTFDLEGPTFRHEQYDEYKAHREEKPDELYAQVPIIERILGAMGIPVFTAKGFEADDVIGTLSRLAAEQDGGVETIIVTGDLDTLQLVDDRTKVYTLRKGMSDTVLYDRKAVKERFGLVPGQMVDYKALRGDPSDNIPGVKGIGEKTATELLKAFGSLDALYASLEKDDKKAKELKPSVREKLVSGKADALGARELCRIRRDVKLKFDVADCRYEPPTQEKVADVFRELNFVRLLSQLPKEKAAEAGTMPLFAAEPEKRSAPAAVRVEDAMALHAALREIRKAEAFAFRTVTESDDPVAPAIAALGLAGGKKAYVLSPRAVAEGLPLLKELFAGKKRKVCHDLKRECKALAAAGIVVSGNAFDLMIASYLLHSGERRHGLGAILAYQRGVPIEDDEPSTERRVERLAAELPHFLPLADDLGGSLAAFGLERVNREIELPLAPVLARMEAAGIAVDAPYLTKLSKELGASIGKLTARIHERAGEEFNVNSPMQLKVVLFEKLGISPEGLKKTAKGGGLSTAAAELEKLRDAHPIVGDILDYRELAKLKSTYVDALPALIHPRTGRIHADFNQTVTATGRLSSSNPNLQNIPTPETEQGRKVRNAFVAGKGKVLLAADYSQIELRIAAHIAKEKTMIAAFKAGEDIHLRTAATMFGEKEAASRRRIAKTINFGILYGMGAQRLAESGGMTFSEARDYIDRYFAAHKGIAAYMEDIKERIADVGHVDTLFGRKRFFRNVKFMNPRERAEAERQAINMPIQGTQADMIKLAMVRIDARIAEKYGPDGGAPVAMVSQVHDELLFEVAKDEAEAFAAEIVPLMADVVKLAVPVVVNVSLGTRWGEMEKLGKGA
jgi:DNA polymerase-1